MRDALDIVHAVMTGTLGLVAIVFIGAIIYAIAPTKAGRSARARREGLKAVERELER